MSWWECAWEFWARRICCCICFSSCCRCSWCLISSWCCCWMDRAWRSAVRKLGCKVIVGVVNRVWLWFLWADLRKISVEACFCVLVGVVGGVASCNFFETSRAGDRTGELKVTEGRRAGLGAFRRFVLLGEFDKRSTASCSGDSSAGKRPDSCCFCIISPQFSSHFLIEDPRLGHFSPLLYCSGTAFQISLKIYATWSDVLGVEGEKWRYIRSSACWIGFTGLLFVTVFNAVLGFFWIANKKSAIFPSQSPRNGAFSCRLPSRYPDVPMSNSVVAISWLCSNAVYIHKRSTKIKFEC